MFQNATQNVLCDGVQFEEDILTDNYFKYGNEFESSTLFHTHTLDMSMQNFSNDVVQYGGINPWDTVQNNGFRLKINSVQILAAIGSLILCILG